MTDELKNFACRGCGSCCRWPGEVRVDDGEIRDIAASLGVPEAEFIARHTAVTRDRRGLTLLETPDGSCQFLTPDNRCRIQDAKPRQCREFPHGWRAPDHEHLCAGLAAATSGKEPAA